MSRNPDFDAVMIKKTELEQMRAEIARLQEQVAYWKASMMELAIQVQHLNKQLDALEPKP